MRTMIETAREALQGFDSRPVEIVDLGGRHFAAVVEHGVAGAYSGITVSGQFVYLYEMSDAGRVARQWWTADPANAEKFHRQRLGPDREAASP
jgi:hypothetical protein